MERARTHRQRERIYNSATASYVRVCDCVCAYENERVCAARTVDRERRSEQKKRKINERQRAGARTIHVIVILVVVYSPSQPASSHYYYVLFRIFSVARRYIYMNVCVHVCARTMACIWRVIIQSGSDVRSKLCRIRYCSIGAIKLMLLLAAGC